MLKLENHLGTTTITTEYFAGLIGNVVSSCYGVVGISASTPMQGMLRRVSGRSTPAQGVKIKAIGDKLVVDIHIKVLYGINVSAIVKSIMNKVRYAVSQAVGLQVAKINVFVDDMTAE
ncbi:Asp23/Gls24 family envelope stress response protein [Bittarella massiliensis (ex Durand et al. 2017)]|uniref:Asp23/Gls24 family envelope stress response protein n=1 Tax=Bittarella massiliensis (ex Durand et al. 2017) TaxID=1720313 RepID=A0ABW9WYP0_9FIRM|nr:Asp23/Gls24 family envelope stress response protein [Bittarella massiliensis (ex Durand et al. 2017)]MZL70273.1 Asp23/Gls24 family envelope stress response protein [Bittarella massiliensis (ex Durand et al. 2017)]MZL80961.1 Asp23/Gls24 family envelope stress response protein [Bittarella massiliensis (ex Durand et al. 2017)]